MKPHHPLFWTWKNMLARCYNPNNTNFHRYGGRGITVCERWKTFDLFVLDVGQKPSPKHSIDRRDNNGPYSPDNWRWATQREQTRNTERALIAIIDGIKYRASDLADLCGLTTRAIVTRAEKGLPYEKVISSRRREMPDNFKDAQQLAWAKKRTQTHCKRGHEFTPENTYLDKRGCRCCRACINAKTQAWRDKIRAQGFDPCKPAALRKKRT